jgi:hypothetical protein
MQLSVQRFVSFTVRAATQVLAGQVEALFKYLLALENRREG